MDLKKQIKPIHLVCPKCKYDFSYNSSYVERNIDKLKREITDIKAQLESFNLGHSPQERKESMWYKRAKATMAIKNKELAELKGNRKVAAQEIKIQTFETFKKKVTEEIGHERCLELIKEAEEEMVFRYSDFAKVNHNHFENA